MKNIEDFARFYDEEVGRVRSVLYRMCPRQDVEDLCQESFLKAWRSLESFRAEASMSTWMRKIAIRTAYDFYRRRETQPKGESLDEDSPALVSKAEFVNELLHQETVKLLLEALSPEHRSVLVLHVMEGMSLEEIAETLDVKIGTLKSRLHYARDFARKFLESRGIDYGS